MRKACNLVRRNGFREFEDGVRDGLRCGAAVGAVVFDAKVRVRTAWVVAGCEDDACVKEERGKKVKGDEER